MSDVRTLRADMKNVPADASVMSVTAVRVRRRRLLRIPSSHGPLVRPTPQITRSNRLAPNRVTLSSLASTASRTVTSVATATGNAAAASGTTRAIAAADAYTHGGEARSFKSKFKRTLKYLL